MLIEINPLVRKRIFAATDRNGDGIVTEQEYVDNRIITDAAKVLFDKMDSDEDGKLTRQEFSQNRTGNIRCWLMNIFKKWTVITTESCDCRSI